MGEGKEADGWPRRETEKQVVRQGYPLQTLLQGSPGPVDLPNRDNAMKLIIFGAGASYGSQATGVPPLGRDLYDALCKWDRATWGSLPGEWADQFRTDFEGAAADFIAHGLFGAPLQWSLADYFFKKFVPLEANLYTRLLHRTRAAVQRLALATLNYDRLLLLAARQADVPLVVGANRHPGAGLPLCLPHGSSCICCMGLHAAGSDDATDRAEPGGTAGIVHTVDDFDRERGGNDSLPVMSCFEAEGRHFSCEDFIREERHHFGTWVRTAEGIAIVGLQVRPEDRHIWDHVAEAPGQVVYFSGEAAASRYRDWAAGYPARNRDEVHEKGFADGFEALTGFLEI